MLRTGVRLAGMAVLTAALAATVGTALAPVSHADTLLIDGVRQARAAGVQRPSRGMSMDKVTARFGQPQSTRSAVGDPPITRWEYADFVVYFEYKHVIHSVQKH